MWKILYFVFILLMGLLLRRVDGRDTTLAPPRGQQRSTVKSQIANSPHPEGFIVGGDGIDIKQAPFQVSLQKSGHFCGGTIASSNCIVTAAHCLDGQSASALKVRVGSTQHAANGLLKNVTKTAIHPRYNRNTIDYDYGIMLIYPPINFDETKKAVKLPNATDVVKSGSSVLVSGWGDTLGTGSNADLRQVTVPVVDPITCKAKYKNFNNVTDRMICAGELNTGGKDSCQGDSGGPCVNKDGVLVGIVSWGKGCAAAGSPGVYSKVSAEVAWIKKQCGIEN